jgi:4,5-DOPA dioxygenase extradiol
MRQISLRGEKIMATSDISSLFLSHGSPLSCFEDTAARRFLLDLGGKLGKPTAVVAVSAHWLKRGPTVGAAEYPETIHDFGGFPDFLYRIQYPANGAPQLAQRVATLLNGEVDSNRGLDHGIWSVMSLLWPEADVPVIPVAVQPRLDPRAHYAMGQALRPLSKDGVLVIGTGSATHNLRAYMAGGGDGEPQPWVTGFIDWLAVTTEAGDLDALLEYRTMAPHAAENHPTDEHFLPFFTALGASSGHGRRIHASVEYGVISMDDYAFE